jgi:tetratricopeptide (TPR) repeat protein
LQGSLDGRTASGWGDDARGSTPHDHYSQALTLANRGTSSLERFQNSGVLAELEEAINALSMANRVIPENHPRKLSCVNNLGISLCRRFERLGDIAELDKAITALQQAVRLTPDGHPDKPGRLNNLGNSLQSRFERLGDIAELDKAITAHQQAVRLTPDGHPDKPGRLNNLGRSFRIRHSYHHDDATFAQAISTYSQSAQSSSGPPSPRFAAARMWAALCFSIHSDETIGAYSALISLLPRVVWLGRTVDQRYTDISTIGDAVTDAAAAAVHFGKFDLALEWLEQGRSIVWGQMLQLRSPLDKLRGHYPDEANELEKISRALDSAGVTHSDHLTLSSNDAPQSLEEVSQAHRRLAEAYDRILRRIRNLPGFGEFLQPEKSASLCSAATSGSVVIVNAHKSGCDALILLPHSSQVSHVPLPRLQVSVAQEMQILLAGLTRGANTLQRHYAPYSEVGTSISDILGHLWSHVVEPILSYLDVSYFNHCPRKHTNHPYSCYGSKQVGRCHTSHGV